MARVASVHELNLSCHDVCSTRWFRQLWELVLPPKSCVYLFYYKFDFDFVNDLSALHCPALPCPALFDPTVAFELVSGSDSMTGLVAVSRLGHAGQRGLRDFHFVLSPASLDTSIDMGVDFGLNNKLGG